MQQVAEVENKNVACMWPLFLAGGMTKQRKNDRLLTIKGGMSSHEDSFLNQYTV